MVFGSAIAMVTDQEIASCVESLLRHTDPSAIAFPSVVRLAEAKLGVDLSHKAAFIRDQIELLRSPSHSRAPHLHSLPAASNPYALYHHLAFQQHIPPSQPASASSSGVATPTLFPQQQYISFQYPTHSLTTDSSVAALHIQQQQQQLQQASQAVAAAAHPAPVTVAAANESAPPKPKRRGGSGGLNKVCGVSPELQPIVGEATLSRTEIVKQLWAYIRRNNLQDPNNKRKIICNEELRRVFETDSTDMFKMNKLLAKHIIRLDCPSTQSKKQKTGDVAAVDSNELNYVEYPMIISDALAKFFGSEEREMLQSEAFSRVWDYVKANQLEDSATNIILCDSMLHELFGCESVPVSGISEMLARHLFKRS